jgi:hypothetical protein
MPKQHRQTTLGARRSDAGAGPRASRRRWLAASRLFTALAVVSALVAGQVVPARSQALELREGLWVGESIANASLSGIVEGTTATFDGLVSTEFTMFVDENSVVDGDWVLDGLGVLLLSGGEVSGSINYDYVGDGALTGDQTAVTMAGTVTSSGVATMGGASFPFSQPSGLNLAIEVTGSDCYALDGDWIYPLDQLAEDAEWSQRDIDGYFYAAYMGDQYDELLMDIEQLWNDERAWADMATDTGNIHIDDIIGLWTRAQVIAHQLAEADDCILLEAVPGDEFNTLFTIVLGAGLLSALSFNEVDGTTLFEATIAVGVLRPQALESAISDAIHRQGERILNEFMASDGDTCDPCVLGGDPNELVNVALAGATLGHTFEIDGHAYTPERISQAVGVFEWATEQ